MERKERTKAQNEVINKAKEEARKDKKDKPQLQMQSIQIHGDLEEFLAESKPRPKLSEEEREERLKEKERKRQERLEKRRKRKAAAPQEKKKEEKNG